MKALLKGLAGSVALLLMIPAAILAGFGHFRVGFVFAAQGCALLPGLPGDYLREAFYRMTLRGLGPRTRISFGTFFSTPDVVIEEGVYIGAYCVIGRARIGRNTQIASHVQILSGSKQHVRDEEGNILGAESGEFTVTTIGANTWIGAAAVVMADVGERTTVGAGSIVARPLPPDAVAVGNPARVIRSLEASNAARS